MNYDQLFAEVVPVEKTVQGEPSLRPIRRLLIVSVYPYDRVELPCPWDQAVTMRDFNDARRIKLDDCEGD